jgi:hypothetical protein
MTGNPAFRDGAAPNQQSLSFSAEIASLRSQGQSLAATTYLKDYLPRMPKNIKALSCERALVSL